MKAVDREAWWVENSEQAPSQWRVRGPINTREMIAARFRRENVVE
jgi:hypothetical protein